MTPSTRLQGPYDPVPERGDPPLPTAVEPAAPESFGRVQIWYGDGKGKTTAVPGIWAGAATATASPSCSA